jgi:hypothetical protein
LQTINIFSEPNPRLQDKHIAAFFRIVAFLSVCFITFPDKGFAQSAADFELVSITLNIEGLGETEMPVAIKNDELYLSITSLFDFLRVGYNLSRSQDSLTGFLLRPEDPFLVVESLRQIQYQGKTSKFGPEDLVYMEGQLFLKSTHFGKTFGLDCVFDFRRLSAKITPQSELPILRVLRIAQTSAKNHQNNEVFVADKTIGKNFRWFNLGAVDWSVNSAQQIKGPGSTRFNLGLGGVLLGGEFRANLIHTTNAPFQERQQQYLWRYANNDNRAIRQVLVGKIAPHSISSIFYPVVGVQVTNAKTNLRKTYGTYAYSSYVQPNWVVDLYVNNNFVDHIRSDAMGLITYNIPLVYGTTVVSIRYIGPWGEEHSFSQNFIIPFTLLPANELEYKVTAGMVEDGNGSFYTQGRVNYGLSDKITVGGGLEYLTSISTFQRLPFVNTAIRLAPNVLFNGEYVHGVRQRGAISYQLPASLQVELDYTRYEQLQEAVQYNYSEERKASVMLPVRFRRGSAYTRLSFSQIMNGSRSRTRLEWMLSMASRGVNLNIVTFAFYNPLSRVDIYSNVSSSIRIPGGILFSPRTTFNYNTSKFTALSLGISKQFSRNFALNASYEQRFGFLEKHYRLGFRYDMKYARIRSNINFNKNGMSVFQTVSGNMLFNENMKHLNFTRNSNVGKGGLVFKPFLDINGNGKKEMFEPRVKGLNVKIYGRNGKKTVSETKTTITGLEPYLKYNVLLDGNAFENVAWRILQPRLTIVVDPNQIKEINVPVETVGEVSGTILLKDQNGANGIGRINVVIYDKKSNVVTTVLTEEDGYFSYLGLKPGRYTARVDNAQLERLNFKAAVPSRDFLIRSSRDGDVVDDLEFVLEAVPGR